MKPYPSKKCPLNGAVTCGDYCAWYRDNKCDMLTSVQQLVGNLDAVYSRMSDISSAINNLKVSNDK
jgi:hypothetical protein